MEIIKRAKGDAGEIIPWNADKKAVQEEVNHRTHKAGYTDRDGQPPLRSRCSEAGKGDWTRPCNTRKYRENYVKIFGHD